MAKSKNDKKVHNTQGKPPSSEASLSIMRHLQSGDIASTVLDPDLRRGCVNQLIIEGRSTAEIADLLGVSDRTIRRDVEAIRETYAIERDPRTVKQIVGGLVRESEVAITRIRSVAGSKEAKVAEQIDGEYKCWTIRRGLIEILQRLGYLPTATVQVSGNIQHKVSFKTPSCDELRTELDRLEVIETQYGSDNSRLARIKQLKQLTQDLEIAGQSKQIGLQQKENNDEDEKKS